MHGMNETQSDAAPGTYPYCGQLLPDALRLRSYQGINDVLQRIMPTVKGLDSIDVVIKEAIKIRPGQAAYQILESLHAIRTKSIYCARLERLPAKHFLRLEKEHLLGKGFLLSDRGWREGSCGGRTMHSMRCKRERRAASHRRHVARRWKQARILANLF